MTDTPPEIAAMVRRMMLARTGAERLAVGSQMFDVARTIVLASFPAGLSESDVKSHLCQRLYGNEVDVEAFSKKLG